MRRAYRYFLPGYVWHITHRCHQRKFLLKFARDRQRYLHWVFEAKNRYGLSVLNYVVTSNHIHLLVKDTGANVIAESMQLIPGRTAQETNQRKDRQGALQPSTVPNPAPALCATIAGLIAVGSLAFVERIKGDLGVKAMHREVLQRLRARFRVQRSKFWV